MDATTAASTIAGPIGNLAANFYFSPQSTARGEAIGLDVISLYGAGRASMLGGVEPETADSVFYFFKPGMVAGVVARGRSTASEDTIAAAHLGAADDYADAHLSGVDPATLNALTDAVNALAATVPSGSWPLFDGYRASPAATTGRRPRSKAIAGVSGRAARAAAGRNTTGCCCRSCRGRALLLLLLLLLPLL
jgi:hypothetical protein